MQTLKTIVAIFNILYGIAILSFLLPLRWKNKNDRVSIVAFAGMIVLYALNIFCMWNFGGGAW